MRDLMKYARICLEEVEAVGIPHGDISEFVVNTRVKSRFGQCRKLPNGKYSINISKALLDESVNDKWLKDTIIHEILHSCKDCMNHGKKWKYYASIMNRKYGYSISRCASSAEMGIAEKTSPTFYKYRLICTKCGHTYLRQRMSAAVQNPSRFYCGYCNGKLKAETI